MPYRERFKELVAEAQAAGRTIDEERTTYLTTEHIFVTAFGGDPRTFLVTERGVSMTRMESGAVVECLLNQEEIPDLEDAHAGGSPFR